MSVANCTHNKSTGTCSEPDHGKEILHLLKHSCYSDEDICSYIKARCCSSLLCTYTECKLSLLHLAVWCDRVKLVKWLVLVKNVPVNAIGKWRDSEHPCTPLALGLLYGRINLAVFLLQNGATIGEIEEAMLIRPPQDPEFASDTDYYDENGPKIQCDKYFKLYPIFKNIVDHNMYYWQYINGFHLEEVEKKKRLYCFGSNDNYVLGPWSQSRLGVLDAYHDNYAHDVKKILLHDFHGMILSDCGKVFSCGNGQTGRLGHNNSSSVTRYYQLDIYLKITDIAIARDHSVFLTEDGEVYTCGDNSHRVLGMSPPPNQLLYPEKVKKLPKSIIGIHCSNYHTVAWSVDRIWCWGHNLGQMGLEIDESKFIIVPKLINFHMRETTESIQHVTTTNGSTVVATTMGSLYVFRGYKIRRLSVISRSDFNIFRPLIQLLASGGQVYIDDSSPPTGAKEGNLTIAFIDKAGDLMYWDESVITKRPLHICNNIKMATFNGGKLLCVSKDGKVFKVNVITDYSQKLPKKYDTMNLPFLKIEAEQIPGIYKARYFTCDNQGQNFAAIIEEPKLAMEEHDDLNVKNYPKISEDLGNLLASACAEDDLHDMKIVTNDKTYYCHKYILAKRSTHFEKLIEKRKNENTWKIDESSEVFDHIIKVLYIGSFEIPNRNLLTQEYKLLFKRVEIEIYGPEYKPYHYSEIVERNCYDREDRRANIFKILNLSKSSYGISHLDKILKKEECNAYKATDPGTSTRALMVHALQISEFKTNKFKGHYSDMPQFHDVEVRAIDGRSFKAHRCILQARSEYLNTVLSGPWAKELNPAGQPIVNLDYPSHIVELVLNYFYSDVIETKDDKTIYTLLTFADNYQMDHLFELCLHEISQHISYKWLETFSDHPEWILRHEMFRNVCFEFISYNMGEYLEKHLLDNLDENLLGELSKYFVTFVNCPIKYLSRIVPINNTEYKELSKTHKVDIESDILEATIKLNQPTTTSKTPKKRKSNRKRTSNSFDLSSPTDVDNYIPINSPTPDSGSSFLEAESDSPATASHSKSSRVAAVLNAQQAMKNESDIVEDFNVIERKSSKHLPFDMRDDFPQLADRSSDEHFAKSPPRSQSGKIPKMVRPSQRERKQSASQTAEASTSTSKDIPKNPWKTSDNDSPCTSTSPNLDEIITREKFQKEYVKKLVTKPLAFVLMEDKAIDELKKFYNVDNVQDEIITVSRTKVDVDYEPVWVQRKK